MRRDGYGFASICALVLFSGCTTARVQSGYDFSKVRRISVAPFEGLGGQVITDVFVSKLVAAGFEVTDMQHPGDVVLKGAVTDYKADHAAIVFLGATSLVTAAGQTIETDSPVLSMSSARGTQEGTVVGNPKAQVSSIYASVGVSARLLDYATGKTLWSGDYAYEALDLPSAADAVVGFLTSSLQRLLTAPNKRIS